MVLCMFCRSLFVLLVLFLLAIVLSVLPRYTILIIPLVSFQIIFSYIKPHRWMPCSSVVDRGIQPILVKAKSIKLVFTPSPLSTELQGVRAKHSLVDIRVIERLSKGTCMCTRTCNRGYPHNVCVLRHQFCSALRSTRSGKLVEWRPHVRKNL